MKKGNSHDEPIRKVSISDFLTKKFDAEHNSGATAAATLFQDCYQRIFTISSSKNQDFQKILKKSVNLASIFGG